MFVSNPAGFEMFQSFDRTERIAMTNTHRPIAFNSVIRVQSSAQPLSNMDRSKAAVLAAKFPEMERSPAARHFNLLSREKFQRDLASETSSLIRGSRDGVLL